MHGSWNKNKILSLLIKASKKALSLQKSLKVKEKITKGNVDLCTNSDIIIEDFFIKALHNPSKNVYVLGEETIGNYRNTDEIRKAFNTKAYVIDPIDGTLNYLNRLPNWAISIGYVQNNTICEGAIALPELREIFISNKNIVYYKKFNTDFNLVKENVRIQTPLSIVKHHNYGKYTLFAASYASQGRIARTDRSFHLNRSCVYSIAKTLTSGYFGYVGQANIWDFAGCIGLFKNMGLSPFYFDPNTRTAKKLPFTITEKYWDGLTFAKHPVLFTPTKKLAEKLIPS